MSMKPPKTVTVLIDSREQKPLLFPKTVKWLSPCGQTYLIRIKTLSRTLDTGDYALAKWPRRCVIERKGAISELHKNLFTKDRARQGRALSRLARAKYPVLLCEFGYLQAFQPTEHVGHPTQVLDRLFQEVRDRNLFFIWLSNSGSPTSRRRVGEIVLRLMLTMNLAPDPLSMDDINAVLGVST